MKPTSGFPSISAGALSNKTAGKRARKKYSSQAKREVIQLNEGKAACGLSRRTQRLPPSFIPDLSHVKIRTKYSTEPEDSIVYPDGYLSQALRSSISDMYQKSLPYLPMKDPHDISRVDYDKTCKRYNIEKSGKDYERDRSDSLDAEAGSVVISNLTSPRYSRGPSMTEELVSPLHVRYAEKDDSLSTSDKPLNLSISGSQKSFQSLASSCTVGTKRSKVPYSNKSMLEAFLDVEYSTANELASPSKKWNTSQVSALQKREEEARKKALQTNSLTDSLRSTRHHKVAYGNKLVSANNVRKKQSVFSSMHQNRS